MVGIGNSEMSNIQILQDSFTIILNVCLIWANPAQTAFQQASSIAFFGYKHTKFDTGNTNVKSIQAANEQICFKTCQLKGVKDCYAMHFDADTKICSYTSNETVWLGSNEKIERVLLPGLNFICKWLFILFANSLEV